MNISKKLLTGMLCVGLLSSGALSECSQNKAWEATKNGVGTVFFGLLSAGSAVATGYCLRYLVPGLIAEMKSTDKGCSCCGIGSAIKCGLITGTIVFGSTTIGSYFLAKRSWNKQIKLFEEDNEEQSTEEEEDKNPSAPNAPLPKTPNNDSEEEK